MLLTNKITIPVVTPYGRKIDEREYRNIPFLQMYPDDKVVIIQWLLEDEKKPVARGTERDRFVIANPVVYGNQEYFGYWGWGSSVKQGQTFGLTQDYGWDNYMYRYVEDGQRFQRWLMAQGWYGLSKRNLRVLLVPPHTKTEFGLVEDGFGYFSDRLEMNNADRITLGRSRGSYTFWQRIPWTPSVADELKPAIYKRLEDISQVSMLEDMHNSAKLKLRLVELNNEMLEHPFVALSIARMWSEYLARVATSMPTGSFYRIAIPTECPTVESGDPGGKFVIARYPIDSYGSIQAVEPVYNPEIAEKEIIQYSLSSRDYFCKGCAEVVTMKDYDAILCTEDLKMAKQGVKAVYLDGVFEDELIVSITQRFAKGCAIGINAQWSKELMGLDHDGDEVEVHPCDGLPALFNAVKGLPYSITPKLPKNKRMLDQGDFRPEMILQNMQNLVGFASNVTSACLGKADQEEMAYTLGYSSSELLHNKLNYAIKVGTDGFKCNIDPSPVVQNLTIIQSKLSQLGNLAPWIDYPGEKAFVRYIPGVYDRCWVDDKGTPHAEKDGVVSEISEDEYNNAIWDIHDGTVSQIARMVLPHLHGLLGPVIKTQPLTYYRRWAEHQDEEVIASVKAIRNWWNMHYPRVNFNIPKEINNLKQGLADEIAVMLERENISRWQAANALWQVAHSARGIDNSAAVVFFAFPEECEQIIRLKPGTDDNLITILTGIDYQIPGFLSGQADVDVVEVVVNKAGRMFTRKALVGLITADQLQPGTTYPRDMIGLVALNANQPEVGHYQAVINKTSEKAWSCMLMPV